MKMRRRALVRALVDYLPGRSQVFVAVCFAGISQSLHALPSLTFFPRAQLRDSCGRLCLSSGPGLSADGSRRSAPMEVALHGSAAGRVMTVCHPLFFLDLLPPSCPSHICRNRDPPETVGPSYSGPWLSTALSADPPASFGTWLHGAQSMLTLQELCSSSTAAESHLVAFVFGVLRFFSQAPAPRTAAPHKNRYVKNSMASFTASSSMSGWNCADVATAPRNTVGQACMRIVFKKLVKDTQYPALFRHDANVSSFEASVFVWAKQLNL